VASVDKNLPVEDFLATVACKT